jgi:predicted deacylase
MEVTWTRGALSGKDGEPGVRWGSATFTSPLLQGYTWPIFEAVGSRPGPRLCVTAGVHVNEVSSIEAAVRLQQCFDPETLCGSVSIIPVVNLPALYEYTEYTCPVDGKNLNFTFPGTPDGTFSQVLCHALLRVWAESADCYIDLHGGDLRENVSKFIMYQRGCGEELDARRRRMAQCFDADMVIGLEPELMNPGQAAGGTAALGGDGGRPPTACAVLGKDSVMAEAGANGIVEEECVMFHLNGVLGERRRETHSYIPDLPTCLPTI